jgi:hypothetical protein
MKKVTHSAQFGATATTILMAVGFIGFVMLLSYLFITANS